MANAHHRFNPEGWRETGNGTYVRMIGQTRVYYTPGAMLIQLRGKDYHGVQPEDVTHFINNRIREDAIALQKENERRVPMQQVGMSAPKKVAEAS